MLNGVIIIYNNNTLVRHAVPKAPGSIPGTGTHIFFFFFFFFFSFFLSAMGNYQSPLKRAFEVCVFILILTVCVYLCIFVVVVCYIKCHV